MLAAVAVVSMPFATVRAADPADPAFVAFADDLRDLVPARLRPLLAEATEADDAGDHYHPSGESPALRPAEADLELVASFRIELSPEAERAYTGPGGALACATPGTICSPDRAGTPGARTFRVYAGRMRGVLDPATGRRGEFGVTAFDETPRDGRPAEAWEAIEEFPGDFLAGSNLAWVLLSEDGGAYVLRRLEYGPGDAGFLAAPTGAVALRRGASWAIVIPENEWEGTKSVRSYVFLASTTDPSFSPATAVVDTAPAIERPMQPSRDTPLLAVTATDVVAGDTGPNSVWLAVIGVGAVLAVLGLWLLAGRGIAARASTLGQAGRDPCAALLGESRRLERACAEAQGIAAAVRVAVEPRLADASAAERQVRITTRAREAIERTLATLRDRGTSEAELRGAVLAVENARAAETRAAAGLADVRSSIEAANASGDDADRRAAEVCRRLAEVQEAYRTCVRDRIERRARLREPGSPPAASRSR